MRVLVSILLFFFVAMSSSAQIVSNWKWHSLYYELRAVGGYYKLATTNKGTNEVELIRPNTVIFEDHITLVFEGSTWARAIVDGVEIPFQRHVERDGQGLLAWTMDFDGATSHHVQIYWSTDLQDDFWLTAAIPKTSITIGSATGWHTTPFTVTPQAVTATGVTITSGQYGPVTISAEGETSLNFYAVDSFGYRANATFVGKIDSKRPTLTPQSSFPGSPFLSSGQYQLSLPVRPSTQFTVSAADVSGGSGVDPVEFKFSQNSTVTGQTIGALQKVIDLNSGESGDYTWTFNVKDYAGNSAIPLVVTQRLLFDPPVLTFPELEPGWQTGRTLRVLLQDDMNRTHTGSPTSFQQFDYSLDSGSHWTSLIPQGGAIGTITLAADGEGQLVKFRAKDEAGTSPTSNLDLTVNVDTQAPSLSLKKGALEVSWAGDSATQTNFSSTSAFTYEIGDLTSKLQSLKVSWDDPAKVPQTQTQVLYNKPNNGTARTSQSGTFTAQPGKDFTYTFTAEDIAGNETIKRVRIAVDQEKVALADLQYSVADKNSSSVVTESGRTGYFQSLKLAVSNQQDSPAKPQFVTWTLDGVSQPNVSVTSGTSYSFLLQEDLTGLVEDIVHTVGATVTDQAGNTSESKSFTFRMDKRAPDPTTDWVNVDSGDDALTFTVTPTTDASGKVYQIIGQNETLLWDKTAVLVGGNPKTGSFSLDSLGSGTITIKAVDQYGNASSAKSFTVVRPPLKDASHPSGVAAPTLSSPASADQTTFTVGVTSSSPGTVWSNQIFTLSYVGRGYDVSFTAPVEGGLDQNAVSKVWTRDQLAAAKAYAAGDLGYLRAWVVLTPQTPKTATHIVLARRVSTDYVLPNHAPVLLGQGTWRDYLGKGVSPFVVVPTAIDPDQHPQYFRYKVTVGGIDYFSSSTLGMIPLFDTSSLKTAQNVVLAEAELVNKGATLVLQVWAGENGGTESNRFASDVLSLSKTFDSAHLDVTKPVVGTISPPWSTSGTWSRADNSAATVVVTDAKSGLGAVVIQAIPLTADGPIDTTRPTLVLPVTGLTVGAQNAAVTASVPIEASGLYQLSVTVTDRAGNSSDPAPGLKAGFDFQVPTLSSTTVNQRSQGTGSAKRYFADALGAVKATLVASDPVSGLASWEYQLISDSAQWQAGGPWVSEGSQPVTVQPTWGATEQKVRWRVVDKAGNPSLSSPGAWVNIAYSPELPDFQVQASGFSGQATAMRSVKSLSDLSVTVSPSMTVQWFGLRHFADGTTSRTEANNSWEDLRARGAWWVDGGRYSIEAVATNDNQISASRETEVFVLDRTGPQVVELALVPPSGVGRQGYYRQEPFGVRWTGGEDEQTAVQRTVRLAQVVNGVTTILQSKSLGAGATEVTMDWGTKAINWSAGTFQLTGTAENEAGIVTTSAALAVPIQLEGPWLSVAVPPYTSGKGSLATSWSVGNVDVDRYRVELWQQSSSAVLLASVETENREVDSQLLSLERLSLANRDLLVVKVIGLSPEGASLVAGTSVGTMVDNTPLSVRWDGLQTAVTSRRVGGGFTVEGSASGISNLTWKIETRPLGATAWSPILGSTGALWREITSGGAGTVEENLAGKVGSGDLVRLTLRAENGVGQVTEDHTSDLVVDDSAPPVARVLDMGKAVNFQSQSLTFNWRLSQDDPESGIKSYEYGWFVRGTETAPATWTTLPPAALAAREFTASIDLKTNTIAEDGQVVVLAVRATNQAGLTSVGYSDGIILDHTAPLVYSVGVFADQARTKPLVGYVPTTSLTNGKVYIRVGALDGQSSWSNGAVTAERWNETTQGWDTLGSAEPIESDETELIISGGLAAGGQWRLEALAVDSAGNTALGVSDGFLVEGDVPSVVGLQMSVDQKDVNLSWGVDDIARARWVHSYRVLAVWTDANGQLKQTVQTVSHRSVSFEWGPAGMDLLNGGTAQFTVTALSYTGAFQNSATKSDYQVSFLVDTKAPELASDTRTPWGTAIQYFDRVTGHLAYGAERGVSSLQWRVLAVPGEVALSDWEEKNWVQVWDFEKELSLLSTGPVSGWQGKKLRLQYRAANTMGIWSDLASASPVSIDLTAPEVAVNRASSFANHVGAVPDWTITVSDRDSGVVSIMAALVPVGEAASYRWPAGGPVIAVDQTGTNAKTLANQSITLSSHAEGTFVPLIRTLNGTGHWFVQVGAAMEIDRTPPALTSIIWPGAPEQILVEQGVSKTLRVANGPSQNLSLLWNEPVTAMVEGPGQSHMEIGLGSTGSTVLPLSSLEPGQVYNVAIVAVDQAGNQTSVNENLRYNAAPKIEAIAGAFTVRPGNPVEISSLVTINDDEGTRVGDYPLSFTWVAGNGTSVQLWQGGGGRSDVFGSASHTTSFLQTGSAQVTLYQGTLIVTDKYGKSSDPYPMKLRVENSHEGTLMVDEFWTDTAGPFELRGWVTVPNQRTLTLNEADVRVTGMAGDNQIQDAGILVLPGGTLKIQNSGAASSSTFGSLVDGTTWKGLVVQGSVLGSRLQVHGAERGIVVRETGNLSLSDSIVTGNRIGLHLLGGSLNWTGGIIASQDEYGVKEEQGGSYIFKNTQWGNNAVNYYEAGRTNLSLGELNEKPGNTGNTELPQ